MGPVRISPRNSAVCSIQARLAEVSTKTVTGFGRTSAIAAAALLPSAAMSLPIDRPMPMIAAGSACGSPDPRSAR